MLHFKFLEKQEQTKPKARDKNHMTLSINGEKAFGKIQHPFMIKAMKKLGVEGMFLNIIKEPRANIIPNGEQLKPFPLNSGTRQGIHFLHSYSIQFWKSKPEQ
jgi:hypothetical protein